MFYFRGCQYRAVTLATVSSLEVADKILAWWEHRERGRANWERRWAAYKAFTEFLGEPPDPAIGDVVQAYRCTNRKDEPKDVGQGTQIISHNHATGEVERGMSVALGLEYAGTTALKWVYPVEGTVVDFGSDGEPVLTNVNVVGPIESTAQAVQRDWKTGVAGQRKKKRQELLQLTGLDPHVLFVLNDKNWFRAN